MAFVLCTTALSNSLQGFSNYGNTVDVIAPGVDIKSASMEGGYVSYDVTSMATPHVAAVCALFKCYDKKIKYDEALIYIKNQSAKQRNIRKRWLL